MKIRQHLLTLSIIFTILTINLSCNKSLKEVENEYLTSIVVKLKIGNNIKWVVVLPGLGCHGCIQEGEAFMKDYINNKEILFVLTKISSLKILQQKLNLKIKDHLNIYIDESNNFSIPSENTIYPCIAQIEDGKVKMHEFQSPKNGLAFRNLKKLIKKFE